MRLSTIVLCKEPALAARLDAQDASVGPPALDDPLRAGGAPVSPDLSGVFRTSSERELCIYFLARPRDISAPVRAAFQFLREGAPALRFEQTLPPADEKGEIRHLTQVELGRFRPGRYELRVTLSGGAESATSAASFRIEK
jgi:hypothetical protein